MQNNVVLVGMPGSGKSTVGVLLAKVLKMAFLDTDLLVQTECKQGLQEIIDQRGIEAFLQIEQRVVYRLDVDHTVIATGGSVIYSDLAMTRLSGSGVVVFLHAELPVLLDRLRDSSQRGIALPPGQTIEGLYKERTPKYFRWSDITFEARGMGVEETVQALAKEIEAYEGRL